MAKHNKRFRFLNKHGRKLILQSSFRGSLETGVCLDRIEKPAFLWSGQELEGIYMLRCTTSVLWPDIHFICCLNQSMRSVCVFIHAAQVPKTCFYKQKPDHYTLGDTCLIQKLQNDPFNIKQCCLQRWVKIVYGESYSTHGMSKMYYAEMFFYSSQTRLGLDGKGFLQKL